MCDSFHHGVLRVAVAQICQSMGWDSVQKSTHDLLTDVLQKYLEEIGKSAYGYSQLYCRSEPNLDDLGLAFEDVGVPLHELEDYATQVEQAPFIHQLPWYPKSKANALHHPHNGEVVDRPEYYHDHLPPLIKVLHSNEDADEKAEADETDGQLQEVESLITNGVKTAGEETPSVSVAVKRPLDESPPGLDNDTKKRRVESLFSYNSNRSENGMDILQALQGDISSPSPTPSPTTVISFEDKLTELSHTLKLSPDHKALSSLMSPPKKGKVADKSKPLVKAQTTKTSPKTPPKKPKSSPKPKAAGLVNTHESPKSKPQAKPVAKLPKTAKEKSKSPSPMRTPPEKSPTPPPKQSPVTSPVKKPSVSPMVTPKPKPAKKSPSPGVSKKMKKKVKPSPVSTPDPPMEVTKEELPSTPSMPKMIIKSIKQEPDTAMEYSVSEFIPSKTPQTSDVKKKVKKLKTKHGSVTNTKETKDGQSLKVKAEPREKGSATSPAPLKFTLSQFVSSEPSTSSASAPASTVTEIFPEHKKKKKKHKEKEKEKKYKKIKKEPVEPSSAGNFVGPPIPRLKLKLDAGYSTVLDTSTSSKTKGNYPSNTSSSDYSYPGAAMEPSASVVKQDRHYPATGDSYKAEPVARTVRTQTLSTTVVSDGRVYICPSCQLPDDGSFMIGCDSCDEWFHGTCVGILKDPGDNTDWFCVNCKAKSEKSKKKKKKKNKGKIK